jgi:sodium-dependent dicarboxylate transporter 2/3/5
MENVQEIGMVSKQRKRDLFYYVRAVIGIGIMGLFGYLPAVDPITPAGMHVLGQFIGLIFLWSCVDIVWPTFIAIVFFGFIAKDVYPASFAQFGIYEAAMQSLGNWCTVIGLGILLMTIVFEEVGVVRRIAHWFFSRNFSMKSGWHFTFMIFLGTFVIGLFLDVTATQLFMLAIMKEVFHAMDLKKGEKWPAVITIGITFVTIITFVMTPICHGLTILFMGIYSAIVGVPVNWVAYMGVAVPVGTVLFLVMFLFFRFVIKPDISKFNNLDRKRIAELHPGPMEKREKLTIFFGGLIIFCWIFPGFISILAPTASITIFFEQLTAMGPIFIGVAVMAIIRVGGKPLLDISEAMKKFPFQIFFMIAGVMMISSCMGEETVGINAWLAQALAPMISNMNAFGLVVFLTVASILITNVSNNVPVGILMITVGVPMALQIGISPGMVAVAVTICSGLAYTIPPAFIPIGICYADPFGGPARTLKYGLCMVPISIAVCVVLIYPLASLIF